MSKFKLNDRVVIKSSIRPYWSMSSVTIVAFTFDNVPVVQLDTGSDVYLEKVSAYLLVSEDEALQLKDQLELEASKLESEFEKIRADLESKLNMATTLVKEASSLAKSCNKDFSSLTEECGPLLRALNASGWRTSAIDCM